MKKIMLAAALAAAPAAAFAQDTAPDGSAAFGFKPYVGIMGGYERFDPRSDFGTGTGGRPSVAAGALIEGVAGVNIPLGPVFVGAEGNIAKGFNDFKYQYGVVGRVGARAGDSGLIYLLSGVQWVEAKASRGYPDDHGVVYGVGVEVGPKDIGLGGLFGGNAGPRLRFEARTYEFDSIRTTGGVVFHF